MSASATAAAVPQGGHDGILRHGHDRAADRSEHPAGLGPPELPLPPLNKMLLALQHLPDGECAVVGTMLSWVWG